MKGFRKELCEMLFSTKFINKKQNANFLKVEHLNNGSFIIEKESIAKLFRTSVVLQSYLFLCLQLSARQQCFEVFQ